MKNLALKNFHGFDMLVREGTPDAKVAASSLGPEFAIECALLGCVRERNIVLDLGGYIGSAAIKFATEIPHSIVITVEPSPDNFAVLQLNTARYANIVPVNAAVGSSVGVRTLYSRGTGEWGFTIVDSPKDRVDPSIVASVEVLTVSDLLTRHVPAGVPVSLAKVDIEGGEVEILESHGWVDGVAIICAELHDRIVDGCRDAWRSAVNKPGRVNFKPAGEKYVSVSPDLVRRLHVGARPVTSSL